MNKTINRIRATVSAVAHTAASAVVLCLLAVGLASPMQAFGRVGSGSHSVTCQVTDGIGGALTPSTTSASPNVEVTLTATPEGGYCFSTLAVNTVDGTSIEYEQNGDNTFTFHMPDADVVATATFAASAPPASLAPSVTYLDASGAMQTTREYTLVESGSAPTWADGVYVVGGDYNGDDVIDAADAAVAGKVTTFDVTGGAKVSGTVTLILVDGFTLNVTGTASSSVFTTISGTDGISLLDNASLTVTAQSSGAASGKLNVTGANGDNGAEGATMFGRGGTGSSGTPGCAALSGGSGSALTINAGTVTAIGGKGGDGGKGGYGLNGAGGNGGNGAAGGNGIAVAQTVVNKGSVVANAGLGGTAGQGGSGTRGSGSTGSAGANGSAVSGAFKASEKHIVKAGADAASAVEVAHVANTDISGELGGMLYVEATPKTYSYLAPVYKTEGVPTSGIDHWVTNTCSDYTVVESSDRDLYLGSAGQTNWYVVARDATIKSGGVKCRGAVNLILADGAKLAISDTLNQYAGIDVSSGHSLAIYGQVAGTGMLDAVGGPYGGAGIGGSGRAGSNITINGGVVKATGGGTAGSAGIGGGTGDGSNITINGGDVTASGTRGSAGIGGSSGKAGSNITINGGTVRASGNGGGAGVGGGNSGSASGIYIANELMLKADTTTPPQKVIAEHGTTVDGTVIDSANDLSNRSHVLIYVPVPIPSSVKTVENATSAVYAIGILSEDGTVFSNETATVVYTVTTPGKFFENGETAITNTLNTTINPATDTSAYVPKAVGTPSVMLGIVAQRYPWNGTLDIQYKTPFYCGLVTFYANGTEIGTAKGTGGQVATASIDLNTAAEGAFKAKALKNVKITATIE